MDREVASIELLLEESEQGHDAPVHAYRLDREAVVVRGHLVRDPLADIEEGHEGVARPLVSHRYLAGAAKEDVQRPVHIAEREHHLERVVAAADFLPLGSVAA